MLNTIERLCPNCKLVKPQNETVLPDSNAGYKLQCTNCGFEEEPPFGKVLGRKIIEYDNKMRGK